MDCLLDYTSAMQYKSHSQIARVVTESWAEQQLYCPRCGNSSIERFPNNRAVADFFCPNCRNEYELKSKNGKIRKKVADGAYETFIQRITSSNNPDFFVLSYDLRDLCVNDLWLIPKHFFIPDIVEKRAPLSPTAKRAGWIGCNILFDRIPLQGKISIIKNKTPIEKEIVLSRVNQSLLLRTADINARGWLLDVLNCVNMISSDTFSLEEIYRFERLLGEKHPDNHNIRAKIRQQLQQLRDRDVLEFSDRGMYKKKLY